MESVSLIANMFEVKLLRHGRAQQAQNMVSIAYVLQMKKCWELGWGIQGWVEEDLEGERLESRFDQNILYECLKPSI